MFASVYFKALVYQCVSKFLSTCVYLKTFVYQLCISKFLFTSVCVKVLIYECMFQNFYLPLSIYMNYGRFLNFEAHHKHSLFYHIVFTKVYPRLWIFKLLKAHLLCAKICLHEIWKFSKLLSSLQVTLHCLPQIMHKYFNVINSETPQSSSFIC